MNSYLQHMLLNLSQRAYYMWGQHTSKAPLHHKVAEV